MKKTTRIAIITAFSITVIAAVVILVALTIFLINNNDRNSWVLKINEMEISQEEANFYVKQFGISLDERVSSTLSDRKPSEAEKQMTKKEFLKELIVSHKTIFTWALEKGLIEAINFEKLHEQMNKRNEENSRLQAEGAAVYGPVSFDFPRFYSDTFNQLTAKLQSEILNETAPSHTQEELMQIYESEKETRFLNKETGEYLSFEEAKVYIEQEIAQKNYDEELSKRSQAMKVVFNENVWNEFVV